MEPTLKYPHIASGADALSSEPPLEGHRIRIRVRDIVLARDVAGLTPEEIAATVYPSLTLGEVYGALAYYEDHQAEINAAGVEEAKVIRNFQANFAQLIGKHPVLERCN